MIAVSRLLRYGLLVLAFAPLSVFASTPLVYVTNSAGDSIHVVDTTTNKVVQVIKGIEAAHGINFAPDGSKVYVSNESTSTLDVFDREAATAINVRFTPKSGHCSARLRCPLSATSRHRPGLFDHLVGTTK